jgi:hypothetical protein
MAKKPTVDFRETTRADGKSATPKKPGTKKPSAFRETTSLK